MIFLRLDTEHFQFEALGADDEQANDALEMALTYHGEASGLSARWWAGRYDISRTEIEPGEAFRDGQLLYRSA